MQKDNIESIYPITDVQHGMLFHANYDHRSSVYVESMTFSIHGELVVEKFKTAWVQVIERHSALRTFFAWENRDNPLQIVRKSVKLPWEEQDWRNLSADEQLERAGELLASEQIQGFDLSKAPLLRLILVRKGSNTYQFVWSYHHIVLDGWSVGIILNEVFSTYQGFVGNTHLKLDKPQQFKAYIKWLQEQDLDMAKDYWQASLKDFFEPTPLNFGDLPQQTETPASEFSSEHTLLSTETTSALNALAREHRLTLNTFFQGAWSLLLSRYSAEEDVLFGAAVAGRSISLPGIDNMVGLIIGSLPVRVQVAPQASLIPWLLDLQTNQIEARQYEYCSLRDILSWSDMNRSRGQSLFESIMSFNNYEFDSILKEKSANLEIQDVSFLEGSHYPLTLLIDPGEQFRVKINFDQRRFTRLTIKRILDQLKSLLDDFSENPEQPLSAYSMLSSANKQALLIDFNQTASPRQNQNVVAQFEEQTRRVPNSIAIRLNDKSFTYRELNASANQLANYLTQKGVGKGSVVALILDRSPDVLIAILGTLKAGAAYMPVEATLPANRMKLMLSETQAPVVLTTKRFTDRLPDTRADIVYLDSDWAIIEKEESGDLAQSADLDDLVYIIYTSGSTGTPKGAMITHGNLLNYVSWAANFYLQGEKLDFPLFSSLSFDLTVTSIFVPLVSGGSIVVYEENDASNLSILEVFKDNLVDIVKLTPAHLALIKEIDLEGSRVRKMIVGGEDFKRSLAEEITDLFGGEIEIYNEYGPTEATVGCMIHQFDPDNDLAPSVPIGHPIDNTQIYILDQHLNPVPNGVIGEMCIGGSSVGSGYLQRPELTADKFVENPFHPGTRLYRTGDLARWSENGQMQFLGRADHQVKIQGYRVELGEIETILLEHPAIEASVVEVVQTQMSSPNGASMKCTQCGLPGNYPGVSFDEAGVCNTCRDFNVLEDRFESYFKTPDDLRQILQQAKQEKTGKYDCIVLYSGGKDSSYMLYQLVREFGAIPLVFSIDNGYISPEAKENIRRVTNDLGVDLIFGQTPHMNAIFVDSLQRHSNVCDGCFKVIYTLSINLANEKGIKYIFTGLTRGQLFETRLSDMFQARIFETDVIDQTVLDARKAYHKFDDAVSQLMDVEIFQDERIFDEVKLVDFYRYTDVPLQEMYQYLEDHAPWVRPSDSGRSTNCLINDVGIYIHKKERGYHNYALPYSWDVRMGHKTRAEALDDLNDDINEKRVHEILGEIGYSTTDNSRTRLAAYYVPKQPISSSELRSYLEKNLPEYMIPHYFSELEQLPLTRNGKVDRQALPRPDLSRIQVDTEFVTADSPVEQQLSSIWCEVLNIEKVGIRDNFFELGGDSIATIHVMMRVSQAYQIDLKPVELFNSPTIALLAKRIEETLMAEIEQLSDEEAELLLQNLDQD
jgi:amino acid adenylation domain-containing protein